MAQNTPAQGDDGKTEDQRKAEREAAEKQAAEQRERQAADQRRRETTTAEPRAADQHGHGQRHPPQDDGKSTIERATQTVGEAAPPEPSQAELDRAKEQAINGVNTPKTEDRSMEAGESRTYQTR